MLKNLTYFFLILVLLFLVWKQAGLNGRFHQWQYDISSGQKIVTSKTSINKIYNEFKTINFSKLDDQYISQTKYEVKKYKDLVKDANFLIIKGKDIFKYIVGDFRIKDFLPHDDYYYSNLDALGEGEELLWLIDKELLYKLLELQNVLSNEGYNETGFTIVNGYRHPAYNEKVGGAKLSRHLKGQALDLQIGDINDDGFANQKDKTIVLDFLEKKIIKNKGGIGRYPGTMSIHFDVRGYKARWDKQ